MDKVFVLVSLLRAWMELLYYRKEVAVLPSALLQVFEDVVVALLKWGKKRQKKEKRQKKKRTKIAKIDL